ncbi:MAG TPA: group II intron reverse transcriptase/maturase [Steroidobacteraceae bacterium]
MNGRGESDGRVVPTKLPNKGGRRKAPGDGGPYSGTKAETPDTDKGAPKALGAHADPPAEAVEGRRPAKGNTPQQNMLRTQSRERMQSALERVRRAARRDRGLRFTTLAHHMFNVDHLREAYFRLKRRAAPGVDGVTWRQYGRALEENLQDLVRRLRSGAYRAKPVRRVYIPKPDGRQRPLGVPALEDKLVQLATSEVLNAVYETDFLGFSYGFRPGRGQHDALDALCVGIERSNVKWVLDADIRGFFDAIDHKCLMKLVEHRIGDRRVHRLIQKWLKAGVLENGEREPSEEGTPQGGSISPLLANIYLHYALDLWAHQWRQRHCRGHVRIVRYADDFVVGFEHHSEALRFLSALGEQLARYGLELHPDKTRIIEFGSFARDNRARRGLGKPETFDFLGFTHICGRAHRGGRFRVERRTRAKRIRDKLAEIKAKLKQGRHAPIPQQGAWLRSVLEGHYRYYGVPLNYRALDRFRYAVACLWHRSLLNRGQKGRITWARMDRLIERWLPRAKIYHPYPIQRFLVRTRGKSPVR